MAWTNEVKPSYDSTGLYTGGNRNNKTRSVTYNFDGSFNGNATFTKNQNTKISHLFRNTKDFRDITKYNLMRGVPDFGSLVQFNPYETGYAAFIICGMPKFIEALAAMDDEYYKLVENWKHIVEYEFKSFDGLQELNAETITLGDDLNNINVINKVNMQSASDFTLTYDEKSGSPLTKFAKLYLTGIKDPRTQVKTYHGLIHNDLMEPGFENEVFTFLFISTDNTMKYIEAAYLLIGCQLNSADTDMYNYAKGDISKKEVQVKFSGYPITSSQIEKCAQEMLSYLMSADAGERQIIVNSMDFNYTGVDAISKTLESYGVNSDDDRIQRMKNNSTQKYTSDSWFAQNNT